MLGDAVEAVEFELVGERANALGRAGERLEDAIDSWRLLVEVGAATQDEIDVALADVTAATYALLVQRECAGFRFDNLNQILQDYDVPPEALRRL